MHRLPIPAAAAGEVLIRIDPPAAIRRILVFQETQTLGTITVTNRCRGGGMADAVDLKSIVRKDVRVRLPPSAPIEESLYLNDS